jgi:hypothetical protein
MRLPDFESMVRRMAAELPAEYLDGVTEIVVSRHTLPHPERSEVYTMGECIPLPAATAEPDAVQSRVVLYYGSFRALAALDDAFDWREEAWETLTHEVRHHLEWRASAPALEALDRAAEHNFARHDGAAFDPLFYHDGDEPAPGVYRVENDYFLEQTVPRRPDRVRFRWHGREYDAVVPANATLPAYLGVGEVEDPPPGDLVVVLRRRPGLADLFRRPSVWQGEVLVTPVVDST